MSEQHQDSGFGATALTHMLVVEEIEVSRDWYVTVLGASLFREYGGTSAVLQLQGAWLLLVTGGGPTEDKPGVHMQPPADAEHVSSQMIFRVEDAHAAHETLSRRGANFLTPPVVREGETRGFFRDPDGHLLEISEVT